MSRASKETATLEFYQNATSRRWNWRLIAPNGEKLSRGSNARGFSSLAVAWANLCNSVLYLSGGSGLLLPLRCPKKRETICEHPNHSYRLRILIKRAPRRK